MQWFVDLPIRSKLLAAFLFTAVIGAGIGGVGVSSVRSLAAADQKMYHSLTAPLAEMGGIAVAVQQGRVAMRDAVFAQTADEVGPYVTTVDSLNARIDTLAARFEQSIITDSMRAQFASFRTHREAYAPLRDSVLALARAQNDSGAIALLRGDAKVAQAKIQHDVAGMMDFKISQAELSATENDAIAARATWIMAIASLAGLLLAGVVGFLTANRFSSSVRSVAERATRLSDVCVAGLMTALESMARGDTSVIVTPSTSPLDVTSKDEFGVLAATVNSLLSRVKGTVAAYETARSALGETIERTSGVVRTAQAGDLESRANEEGLQGAYRELRRSV